MNSKEGIKNATMDSLSIGAIGTGITIIQTDFVKGLTLVGIGIVLSVLKYLMRE